MTKPSVSCIFTYLVWSRPERGSLPLRVPRAQVLRRVKLVDAEDTGARPPTDALQDVPESRGPLVEQDCDGVCPVAD